MVNLLPVNDKIIKTSGRTGGFLLPETAHKKRETIQLNSFPLKPPLAVRIISAIVCKR